VSTAKLSAVGAYQQCLIRVYKRLSGSDRSMRALARCDERFDQAFGRAEADDACRTPGGASAIRNRIADDLETIVENLTATTHFEQLVISPGDVAVCLVDKTASAIDLAVVIGELRGFGVTQDTAFWIQAWGGDGSRGNVESHAGAGGRGGYAQMTTSLSAFRSAYRTREFHYYLGLNGTFAHDAGGDGGTATLLTLNDLTTEALEIDDTLLIGGAGGGGGAGRGSRTACLGEYRVYGGAGGAGGVAFSSGSEPFRIVAGKDGGGRIDPHTRTFINLSGKGGRPSRGGAANTFGDADSEPGGDPVAPLGGRGGNHASPQIGFANQSGVMVTGGGGRGSDGGNQAGGGGGGGGYTGGGGGNRGAWATLCVSGGGGGGSSLAAAPPPDSPSCAAAPTERPGNPNGVEGFVQITIDLGACGAPPPSPVSAEQE
jgi:hypothetical protein